MLFDKEKDLILKLTNIVLILWLIGAISALQFTLTDMLLKEPKLTLSEYKTYYCYGYRDVKEVKEEVIEPDVNDCENQYAMYEIEHDKFDNSKLKFVIISLGNVIIVSTALYFINKKERK